MQPYMYCILQAGKSAALKKDKFYCALKLVAANQAGGELEMASLSLATPLPKVGSLVTGQHDTLPPLAAPRTGVPQGGVEAPMVSDEKLQQVGLTAISFFFGGGGASKRCFFLCFWGFYFCVLLHSVQILYSLLYPCFKCCTGLVTECGGCRYVPHAVARGRLRRRVRGYIFNHCDLTEYDLI